MIPFSNRNYFVIISFRKIYLYIYVSCENVQNGDLRAQRPKNFTKISQNKLINLFMRKEKKL